MPPGQNSGMASRDFDRRLWWLDEVAHAGPEHLDADYVAGYDHKSPTEWAEEVAALRALGIDSTSTVVDIGPGTGTFARAIAPHVARVVAVDISQAMVARMQELGIEAVRAGFLTYEHAGARPDAVFTRNALHHLPDFWKAISLRRIAALLRPGGVFMLEGLVYSFEPGEASTTIADWLAAAPTLLTRASSHRQVAEAARIRVRAMRA